MKQSRFLVLDSNVCFAGIVRDVLREHIPTAIIDVAANVWELRRRLSNHAYTMVLADTDSVTHGPEVREEHGRVTSPVVVWRTLDGTKPRVKDVGTRVLELTA